MKHWEAYEYFDKPFVSHIRDSAIVFYCIVCKAFVTRLESFASVEIGGWACAYHTHDEMLAAKPKAILDRTGREFISDINAAPASRDD